MGAARSLAASSPPLFYPRWSADVASPTKVGSGQEPETKPRGSSKLLPWLASLSPREEHVEAVKWQ